MTRRMPRSITHVQMSGGLLDESQKNEIVAILVKKGFEEETAWKFVKGINSAYAGTYHMNPAMASGGERIAWLSKVRKTILALQELLVEADAHEEHGLQILKSEDLEALDSAFLQNSGQHGDTSFNSPSVELLKRWEGVCEAQRAKVRKSKPGPGPRQLLANELASLWEQHFGTKPTASVYESRGGIDASLSPFIKVLCFVIETAEQESMTEDQLRGIADRAITELKERNERVSKWMHG